MLRFAIMRKYTVLRHLLCARRIHSNGLDSEKNILFGGDLKEILDHSSLGRLIYDRLNDPSRADKIIQVYAASGETMNTQTFLKQSVAVAMGLQEQNIKKGDFVLLVGSNSFNLNIATVGVLLLGAVVVPISKYANPVELRHLLTLIKPKFFICESQMLYVIRRIMKSVLGPIDSNNIFLLDDFKHPDSGLKCFPEFIEGKAENWKSFTPVEIKSPKEELTFVMKSLIDGSGQIGVGLTHHNMISVISRYEAMKEILKSEVILMVQKIIWMSGVYSILLSCCFGSELIVMHEFEEEFFMKAIETHQVTTAYLYPSKIWQLYKFTYPRSYDLSSCRRIYVIGWGISDVLTQLMKKKNGLVIKPAYAKSEMSGIVVEPVLPYKEGSMGRLVPMCYAKVVSPKTNEICGPKTPGEFCVKGPTLMKGYVNEENATKRAIDKDGFFHTGDYGFYDEEGYMFLLDRVRNIIKYKDHEISPVEVEGVLKSHDSIKDCVVSGIAHPEDGHRLVAFVVLQTGKTATVEEINKFIECKLPDHKQLKGGVVFLSKVPRSRESDNIKRIAINKVLSKYRLVTNPEVKQESEDRGEERKEESSSEAKKTE